MNTLHDWATKAMQIMRKKGLTRPTFIERLNEWEEFKQSGFTAEELSNGMSEILKQEREVLVNKLKNI